MIAGSRPRYRWRLAAVAVAVAVCVFATPSSMRPAAPAAWSTVHYGALVDGRQPTHSGQSVDEVLVELRASPAPANPRPLEGLIDPLLEPYAFVLADAVDSRRPPGGAPFVEIGALWRAGQAQPAWAELLRSRRYLVESDGHGRMRAFLPLPRGVEPGGDAVEAARGAWNAAWPIVRHALAAEGRRKGGTVPTAVDVYAYSHDLARTEFEMTSEPVAMPVTSTAPSGHRPPLDLEGLARFLDSRLELEGLRLEGEGSLRWLGSRASREPSLLGRPLALADLAVAYRAVFHGGLAEPYMSLDRGLAPQTSLVNYGGRLRDTGLGLVSLLCDIRFKTFSEGIDIETGRDLREELRQRLPSFRTHLERLAEDSGSAGMAGQQTRLWFYPDDVDLVLSPQGDVLVMRRVRMSAASERFETASGVVTREPDAPWTTATVAAINRDYDRLAATFPELADLDQVVRMLSTFTWLRRVEAEGGLVPELDTLLALELPALSTPREFPQLLAFNALPPAGTSGQVTVFERIDISRAIDRLEPLGVEPLPPRWRFERALEALDRARPEQAALARELDVLDADTAGVGALDFAAHRAERLRMHDLVLSTLDPARRDVVAARFKAGEQVRVFSVGIGGLDLGMQGALDRATERSRAPMAPEDGSTLASPPKEPRAEWRVDPSLPAIVLPDHGLAASKPAPGDVRRSGGHRVELGPAIEKGTSRPAWSLVVYGEADPEPSARRLRFDASGAVASIERVEGGRLLRFALATEGDRLTVRLEPEVTNEATPLEDSGALPSEIVLMRVLPAAAGGDLSPPAVTLRIDAPAGEQRRSLEAAFPRAMLQRLVLGREADRTPGQSVSGLAPLPPSLASAKAVMLVQSPSRSLPPWDRQLETLPGEEDPVRLARALNAWWSGSAAEPWRAVLGVAGDTSVARWETAPSIHREALLLLPGDAFPGEHDALRGALKDAWGRRPVADVLPAKVAAPLVILVSAEAPASCAERVSSLASSPVLAGKLLATWCLAGPVRPDLPGSWLETGKLAGVATAEAMLVGRREVAESIGELARALERADTLRVEQLPAPFLWFF